MSPKKAVATKKATTSSEEKKVVKVSAKERYINPINYLYALLILVGGILLVFLIFNWYNSKKEEQLLISYLISSNTIESSIDDLNSISLIKQEAPSSYFIYMSYTKDENIYNLEKSLKKLIDKYKLNDIFYYVDLTKLKESNSNYLDLIKESLNLKELDNLPALIYIQDGEVKEVLDGVKNTLLKITDIEQLLDIYEFETIN